MARRGMKGQLNMFDFFNSLDAGVPGEVEMVSLVPDFEDDVTMVEEEILEVEEEIPKAEEEIPKVEEEKKNENVAMYRSYTIDGIVTEIAYINYNKVRITKGKETPFIKEFSSTKEAVDYYVEQMQALEAERSK